MAVMEMHLHSETLTMDTEIHVIIPNEHDSAPRKTLWLLHGDSGDSSVWLRHTTVERIAEKYNVAVIMPDGIYSCFTDMYKGNKFATYVTAELPGVMRRFFPKLSPAWEDNYVCGYSNGGYGAFVLGLTKPYVYSAIGAFSGSNKVYADYPKDGSKRAHDMYIAFGDPILGSPYDTEHLAREALASGLPLPRIYHASGELEIAGRTNHMELTFNAMEGNPFDYRHHVYPGLGHVWPLWEAELEIFLGQYLKLPEYKRVRGELQTDFHTPWNTPARR